ncbi:lytic transglycosylase domain-containing protein [Methylonatrum kenyense]|uniref:lytic transglycosylase domain-containing protein n=1 Tax=Methylonatrum kenyense TaxID=455253 RepID=UPI0020C1103C|nr:lytic transglycosylase domain-containing protein [Methylonatrum kenyense]MCK8516092.1 lytic transglycosylase domain-containing protein [Methylonatrum kenyense]
MNPRICLVVLLLGILLPGSATAYSAQQQTSERLYQAMRDIIAASRDGGDHRQPDAEWLAEMSERLRNRVPESDYREAMLQALYQEARLANLEPELVLAVIEVESNFDRFALSHAGARGLMQVMPFWLETLGNGTDNLFRVRTNLRFGCTILRHYLDLENGNLTRALARYNGSLGQTWYPDRVYQSLAERWHP